MNNLLIKNTEIHDLDFACYLYEEAIKYQKKNGYPTYRWDDRVVQKKYIEAGCHYKVISNNDIAAIFNIQFQDKLIWREMDDGTAIYLHGVLINPPYKGKRIFGDILSWVSDFAKRNNKQKVRLDTWYNNPNLFNYYSSFGFEEVEEFQTPDGEDIPLNCRGNLVTLMEYKV